MEKYKNILLIVFISAIGGAAGVFFKIALQEVSPDVFTFLRFSISFIAFLPFLLKEPRLPIFDHKKLILISLLATANVLFFVYGLEYTTATISTMLYAAAPLLVGIFSWQILKEKIGFSKWVGIAIGFFGLLAIILAPKLGSVSAWNGTLWGNFIIGLAVAAFSLYSVLSKKYHHLYSPMLLTRYFVATTIVSQGILLLFHFSDSVDLILAISSKVWLILLYAGVLDTTLYYFIYQYVVKRGGTILASMVFYLQPVSGTIFARLILGEQLTGVFVFGSILIFLGITLVFWGQYRPRVNS